MKNALLSLLVLFATPVFAQEVAPVSSVSPGKVHWHSSLEEAVDAAKKSGKPVFHFQLLGRLDQELC